MKSRIMRFLSPPSFAEEERTRAAGLINVIIFMIAAGAVLFIFFSWTAWIAGGLISLLSISMILILAALKFLLHQGHVRLVGTILCLVLWLTFTILIYEFDGMRDTATSGYFFTIVITSLILGGWAISFFAALSSLSIIAAYWAENGGILVTSLGVPPSPIDLFTILVVLNLTALLTSLIIRRMVQGENAIRAERNKAQGYLDIAGAIILALDVDCRVTLINKKGCDLLGLGAEEIVGQDWFERFLPPRLKDQVRSDFQKLLVDEFKIREYYENPILTGNGEERIIAWHNTIMKDAEGRASGSLSSGEDITDRKRAEIETEKRKHYLEGLLSAAPDAIVTLDAEDRIVEWNRGAEKLFGYLQVDALGQKIDSLITTPEVANEAIGFTQMVMSGQDIPPTETVRHRKDGSAVDVMVAASPIFLDGEFVGAVAVYTDISERKLMEKQLGHLATHDALTNLPNRLLCDDHLQLALAHAHRNGQFVALMVLDLDNFKDINDSFGHAMGDKLLQAVSERLTSLVRASDTVARVGGDEFTLIFPGLEKTGDAAAIGKKILKGFQTPFSLEGVEVRMIASMGIAIYPTDSEDRDQLMKKADFAMYRSKQDERNKCQRYTDDEALEERRTAE